LLKRPAFILAHIHVALSFSPPAHLPSPVSHLPGHNLTMAQKFRDEGAELAESPRPLLPDRQESPESVHPGLRPSLVNVPVTPGIHLGEYASWPNTGESTSYFSHDLSKLRQTMAQSPSDAAAGAKTNNEILRRMSLSSPGLQRKDSLLDVDPRAANPTLGLSGGVISATFCIPHSLLHRKNLDWVSHSQCISYIGSVF
jgi:trehalose 6-phosphate synthase/phosphatase